MQVFRSRAHIVGDHAILRSRARAKERDRPQGRGFSATSFLLMPRSISQIRSPRIRRPSVCSSRSATGVVGKRLTPKSSRVILSVSIVSGFPGTLAKKKLPLFYGAAKIGIIFVSSQSYQTEGHEEG